MEASGESHSQVPSAPGNDLTYESERRFYGTGLEAVVNSFSIFAQRDYKTEKDMSRNAASGTRIKRASSHVRNVIAFFVLCDSYIIYDIVKSRWFPAEVQLM